MMQYNVKMIDQKPVLQDQQVALRKLRMVNNSINLNDLRVPPANRLEKLSGNREFVLSGVVVMRLMLKSRITIRRSKHDE